ncbi:putative naringenin-chalcone synthase [uncultured Sphingopyxis sp.]|uniref:Putative naringenin-chalcone synthase n=1 Tax=uncultured Sphingopyxis sp. TaxID=310581 RepID=A0A1Y5PXW7_9SPHN|nr:type III polyketide synthase [uncultured Sphingopyxis sp.]SBV34829.1 putative naringenin-chalcone synthase [uncultured Sphingopyxis sp.]
MTTPPPPRLNALATAVPGHDIHRAFIDWAAARLSDERMRALFTRMAARSGIDHRWSVLPPTPAGGSPVAAGGFYDVPGLPPTSVRMAAYADHAPELAMQAIAALDDALDPARVTHLVVASCTGFVAPGIDQILARRLGLTATVERVLIGFMGCYAGVTALRTARHIVRSEPGAVVLVVSVELSTLHLSLADAPEPLLAMLQFSDGAAAGIVSAAAGGLELGEGRSLALGDSEELIRWDIGDRGFEMTLSGEVPGRLRETLARPDVQRELFGDAGAPPPLLAVHAGGRSVLDAVEHALAVAPEALADSRAVLARFGNMSSATILFVLADMMARGATGEGIAIAFGPGLAAEAIRFRA